MSEHALHRFIKKVGIFGATVQQQPPLTVSTIDICHHHTGWLVAIRHNMSPTQHDVTVFKVAITISYDSDQ